MIKKMYSLYDIKSEFYSPPSLFHNDEDAKRGMSSLFNNPESQYAKYPEDFNLCYLGTYNDNSGNIKTDTNPTVLCSLASLNPRPEQEN